MSTGKSETDEEEQAEMLMRALTEKNVTKIEKALAKTKKHGKGFVLSSHFYKPKPRQTSSSERNKRPIQPRMPIVIGSPIGSPVPHRKLVHSQGQNQSTLRTRSANIRRKRPEIVEKSPRPQSAYITEYITVPIKVDMATQSDDPEDIAPVTPPGTPEPKIEEPKPEEETEHPVEEEPVDRVPPGEVDPPLPSTSKFEETDEAEKENRSPPLISSQENIPLPTREEPEGEVDLGPRISNPKFEKLGLGRRPTQFKYHARMPLSNVEKDPTNPEPKRPNVWITQVPASGGEVNSPFYMQVQLPQGALRGDVIMKFQTQSFKDTHLRLRDSDKLCSEIIDVNMMPLAYSLHKKAKVRVRILEECVNQYDEVTIIGARHFQWAKKKTEVETVTVNGNTQHYAVTATQQLGKFAVITSRRQDSFVMTSAGGTFASTTSPDVTIQLNEGVLTVLPHLVEISVQNIRREAVMNTNELINNVNDADGKIVACSPFVEITKEVMGRTGTLEDGVTFPKNIRLSVPISTFNSSENDRTLWKCPTIKVMHRSRVKNGEDSSKLGPWRDISSKNMTLFNPILIQKGEERLMFDTPLPCQVMALVFDETSKDVKASSSDVQSSSKELLAKDSQGQAIEIQSPSKDAKDSINEVPAVCEKLKENNKVYDAAIMLHQKADQPAIINIHIVPSSAMDDISKAMEGGQEWCGVGSWCKGVFLKERDCLHLVFKGGIKLTTNQMDPEISFHSRKWQGYQYQIEATEEAYENSKGVSNISGVIKFVREDTNKVVHWTKVLIPCQSAKPYKSTIVERPLPKVDVFREYKLKWLKNLTDAEKEKYKSVSSP